MENERVQGNLGETQSEAVEDHDKAYRLDFDPRLLEYFFDRDPQLPSSRHPPSRSGRATRPSQPALLEGSPLLIADDGPDGDLRCHVAGHALAHPLHPFEDQASGVAWRRDRLTLCLKGQGAGSTDVACDVQDLLVPLGVEEVLGEREPRRAMGGGPPIAAALT